MRTDHIMMHCPYGVWNEVFFIFQAIPDVGEGMQLHTNSKTGKLFYVVEPGSVYEVLKERIITHKPELVQMFFDVTECIDASMSGLKEDWLQVYLKLPTP